MISKLPVFPMVFSSNKKVNLKLEVVMSHPLVVTKSYPNIFLPLHPGKLTCPLKRDYFNRKYIFQPSFFRGYVNFQGGNLLVFKKEPPNFPSKKQHQGCPASFDE